MTLSSYAQKKFDILNKHKVYIREEQLVEVIAAPDELKKRGKLFFAKKDGIGVVYQFENGFNKILTFYPFK